MQVSKNAAVKATPRKRRKPAPVVVIAASREAVKLAHKKAAGRDVHLEIQRDGSILVANGTREVQL